MKKLIFLILFVTMISSISNSQNYKNFESQKQILTQELNRKGEIYFHFLTNSKEKINNLSNIISMDNVINHVFYFEVFAYANDEEINKFAKNKIDFEILKHPGDANVEMSSDYKNITAWDTYPTYPAYVNMMNNFAVNYPNLCKIVNIGATVQNRQLLCAVISDSVQTHKNKPRFMYSSSIHGDETTAYVLMLRLIDTLLSGYGNDAFITNLVNNCEIWINPLANPDGTYYGGDNNINSARRYNYNNKDLNRNFPDPIAGPNPTGTWQPETIAFMNLFQQFNFTLSMNFHGGAEVFNYPWDSKQSLHPDDQWFINMGKRWVDTVHKYSPPTYMDDLLGYPNYPGVVNGFAWYSVAGGRQDFMTFYKGGREVTLEISSVKLLTPSSLPAYWGYNHRSFLHYIKESLYGIKGIVTDSVSGHPLKAKIYTAGQNDTTWIYSDTTVGDYHRMLPQGTYSLIFSAPNYYAKTISNIQVFKDSIVSVNALLKPLSSNIAFEENIVRSFNLYQNYPNPFNPETNIKFDVVKNSQVTLTLFDMSGKVVKILINAQLSPGTYTYKLNASDISSGIYFYRLQADNFSSVKKLSFIK